MDAESFASRYFNKIFQGLKTLTILNNMTIKESIRIKHGIINSLHYTYFRLETLAYIQSPSVAKYQSEKKKMWKCRNAMLAHSHRVKEDSRVP